MQVKKPSLDDVRLAAEADLSVFIRLVAPEQVLGICHDNVIDWWTKQDSKSHQLLLFPRDHGKSRLVAFRAAWEITKDHTLRILYISATANLAEKQLSFIKGILTSDSFSRYWPDQVNKKEGKRNQVLKLAAGLQNFFLLYQSGPSAYVGH